MATQGADSGESRGFGGRRGERRGRGRRGEGRGRGGKKDEATGWTPTTKLGRLVKEGKVKFLENIFLHSLPIKEPEIIDYFIPAPGLKDEVCRSFSFIFAAPVLRVRSRFFCAFSLRCLFSALPISESLSLWPLFYSFDEETVLTLLGNEDYACPKANPCRSKNPLQGLRSYRRL